MSKCGSEEGDAQDRRRWRRMEHNPDMADKKEEVNKMIKPT